MNPVTNEAARQHELELIRTLHHTIGQAETAQANVIGANGAFQSAINSGREWLRKWAQSIKADAAFLRSLDHRH